MIVLEIAIAISPSKDTIIQPDNLDFVRKLISETQGANTSGVFVSIGKNGYSFWPPIQSTQTPRDALSFLAYKENNPEVGGIGITGRTKDQTEIYLPGITRRIEKETGKIVFIGNGTSSELPLIAAQKFQEGKLSHPPVIADLFDYRKFFHDLHVIKQSFDSAEKNPNRVKFPFEREYENLRKIVEALDKGILVAAPPYLFGSNREIPQELLKANLVINCMGPPTSTLLDQMRVLSDGGELVMYSKQLASWFALLPESDREEYELCRFGVANIDCWIVQKRKK